jgi:hypothetical protein
LLLLEIINFVTRIAPMFLKGIPFCVGPLPHRTRFPGQGGMGMLVAKVKSLAILVAIGLVVSIMAV